MFVEITPTSLKVNGTKLYPSISNLEPLPDSANTVLIPLPAGKKSNFHWEHSIEKALNYAQKGINIVWELVFDDTLKEVRDVLYQPLIEQSVEHFTKTVYPHVQNATIGVILGRYSERWMDEKPLSPTESREFFEYSGYKTFEEVKASSVGSLHLLRFHNELLAADLQRAAARLPLELPSFLVFESKETLSLVERAYALSPTVFEFVHPIYSSKGIPPLIALNSMGVGGSMGSSFTCAPSVPEVGVMLPNFDHITTDFLDLLETCLSTVPCAVRLLPEEKVVEMWEELETLVYFPGMLSSQGSRALQGFFAAGGNMFEFGQQGWSSFSLKTQ